MTLAISTRKNGPYTLNGITVVFPFNYKVQTAAGVKVVRTVDGVDTTISSSLYSVFLNADQNTNPGGYVTLSPALDGGTLRIYGDTPRTQLLDIQSMSEFSPRVVMEALDKLQMQQQEIRAWLDRTVRLQASNDAVFTETRGEPGQVLTLDASRLPIWDEPTGGGGGGGGGYSEEEIQDIVGAMFEAGTGIGINYNDGAGTVTIQATGGDTSGETGYSTDIADLRAKTWTLETAPKSVTLSSNHYAGDGGGWFDLAASDEVSTDDNALVIVTSEGLRYYRRMPTFCQNTFWPMLKGTGKTSEQRQDNRDNLQAFVDLCILNGIEGEFDDGTIEYEGEVEFDYTSHAPGSATSPCVGFRGRGANTTFFMHYGTGIAFKLNAEAGTHVYDDITSAFHISGFRLYSGTGPGTNTGIWSENCPWLVMSQVEVINFADGVKAYDIVSATFNQVNLRGNYRNLTLDQAASNPESGPNAIALNQVNLGVGFIYGALITNAGVVSFNGGAVEGCGTLALGGGETVDDRWGVKVVDAGGGGSQGCNFHDVYFEGNKGGADLWFADTKFHDVEVTHTVTSSFLRYLTSQYTINNIRVDRAPGVKIVAPGIGIAPVESTTLGTILTIAGTEVVTFTLGGVSVGSVNLASAMTIAQYVAAVTANTSGAVQAYYYQGSPRYVATAGVVEGNPLVVSLSDADNEFRTNRRAFFGHAQTNVPTSSPSYIRQGSAHRRSGGYVDDVSRPYISAPPGTIIDIGARYESTVAAPTAATHIMRRQEPLEGYRHAGHIYGLDLSNNASDATNDIDIAVGSAMNGTGVYHMNLLTALTKRLDATWAAGTGNGMRRSGESLADGTWHIYLIANPTSGAVDVFATTQVSSPTLPPDYSYARRIGSLIRTGGAIRPFFQRGDYFEWKTPGLAFPAFEPGTTALNKVLTGVPTGLKVDAELVLSIADLSPTVERYVRVWAKDYGTDAAVGTTQYTIGGGSDNSRISTAARVAVGSGTQITVRANADDTPGELFFAGIIRGYWDHRGRLGVQNNL